MKILWVKDGKLGHEKQVEALLNEISKDVDTIITEM
jgi:mitochondrial fission protein ELM1